MKKLIGAFLCAVSMVYTSWYMHFGNIFENSGALSKIGLKHHILFVIWGTLTFVTLAYNIVLCYKRYTKNKLYIPLLIASAIGMALTLIFDFDYDIKPDYYFHCFGSLMFSVVMGVTIFVLFVLCFAKSHVFEAFTYITAFILLADLTLLLIYKETALIEVFPIFSGYIMLTISNLRRDKIEVNK